MAMNFNIVKKKEKKDDDEELLEEENELEDEEEDLDDKPKSTMSFDPKKKMIKLMGIIVVVMFVIILILFVMSPKSGSSSNKNLSYSEIEKKLVTAAKSYFKDHPSYLPTSSEEAVEVDYTNLVAEGKMKDLSEYTKDGVNCTANVRVEKYGKSYNYTPNLNCGDSYSSVTLAEKILGDNEKVTSGYGLYNIKGNYIFRGEIDDNYVSIDDILWRIVKVTSTNNVVLIADRGINNDEAWDNRYNEETKYESGKNTYSASRAKEYLDKLYKGTVDKKNYYVFSSKLKSKMATYNVCVAKRSINSESNDNSIECSETLKNQKIGLLTLSDYMMASIDPNCKNAASKSCKNYNYLVTKHSWWLGTADKDSTSKVYLVRGNGILKDEYASSYAEIRPVIYLNDDVMYKSGNGTSKKPYKIK